MVVQWDKDRRVLANNNSIEPLIQNTHTVGGTKWDQRERDAAARMDVKYCGVLTFI